MHPDVFIGLVNVELMYLITNCHPDRIIHVHCPTKFPNPKEKSFSSELISYMYITSNVYLFIFACKSTSLVSLSKGRWPVPNSLFFFFLFLIFIFLK